MSRNEWSQLERMFEFAEKEVGEIGIVCPGAGVYERYPPGSPESNHLQLGSRDSVLDINLTHPIRTT
ncbi:3-hydroxybutyrate dehydrogenase [Blastomyces gilchristii SLH14081]|uniref:3-hydroxybutyrate dehydrogenase n=1 Tax=Blastomyces gilchristii (strain SLH14081) TaxID=559298 RepID=A0A179U9R0_BLAGS|nr:3-hydroxybutyrate dehydrogenase [Blastomyces gilchristii SLH14081]OAT04725.1 3-hydroxybutyrate dehydrogenase [Blastomyces gilchristii SLH14081]